MKLNEVYLLLNEESVDYLKVEYANEVIKKRTLNNSIIKSLDEHGIQSNHSGYEYLKEAILIVKLSSCEMNAITKYVYPLVSKKFGTNSKCVEHSIRHSLKTAYSMGLMDSKYTNCQFIYKIAKII